MSQAGEMYSVDDYLRFPRAFHGENDAFRVAAELSEKFSR
jgi:hypothetical protein